MARTPDEVDRILCDALELLEDDRESVASILAAYPDLEDELRPLLEAAQWIKTSRHVLDPRPDFITSSRRQLLSRIQKEAASVEAATSSAVPAAGAVQEERRSGFFERILERIRVPEDLWGRKYALQLAIALVLVMVFSLFIGGRSITLATSQSLPGDILYPVRIAQENAQLALSITDEKDTQLHTRFADRRLTELQLIVLEGKYEQVPNTVDNFEYQVDQAIKKLAGVTYRNPKRAEDLAVALEDVLTEQTVVLDILAEATPDETRREITRAVVVSQNGARAVQTMMPTIVVLGTTETPPTVGVTPVPTETAIPPTETPLTTPTVAPSETLEPTPEETTPEMPTSTPRPAIVVTGPETEIPPIKSTETPGESQPPTSTPSPGAAITPTHTPKPDTPTASPSPSATPSSAVPTSTPEETPEPTEALPTEPPPSEPPPTPNPPTATSQPPTAAPIQPTDPPTPVPACAVSARFRDVIGNKVYLRVDNKGDSTVTVTKISLDWPASNAVLKGVIMSDQTIWSGGDSEPGTSISNFQGNERLRQLEASSGGIIRFDFKESAASGPYSVSVSFDNGCSARASLNN